MNLDSNQPETEQNQNPEPIQTAPDELVKEISDKLIQRNLEVYKELAK